MTTIKITGTHEELTRVWDSSYADALFGKILESNETDSDGWYVVKVGRQAYTVPPRLLEVQ